jgi:hypothetical protein
MRYIWLRDFEGTGKSAKVSLESLVKKNDCRIIETKGKIGRRIQKPIQRRNAVNVAGEVEE